MKRSNSKTIPVSKRAGSNLPSIRLTALQRFYIAILYYYANFPQGQESPCSRKHPRSATTHNQPHPRHSQRAHTHRKPPHSHYRNNNNNTMSSSPPSPSRRCHDQTSPSPPHPPPTSPSSPLGFFSTSNRPATDAESPSPAPTPEPNDDDDDDDEAALVLVLELEEDNKFAHRIQPFPEPWLLACHCVMCAWGAVVTLGCLYVLGVGEGQVRGMENVWVDVVGVVVVELGRWLRLFGL